MSLTQQTKSTPAKTSAEPTNGVPQPIEGPLKWLAPASVAFLLMSAAFLWWQGQSQNEHTVVFNAYVEASSPQDVVQPQEQAERLKAVAEAYPDSQEAPLALLQAGALLYNAGDFPGALDVYSSFATRFPDHPLFDNAEWGRLNSLEANGDVDAAFAGYQSYKPDSLLYPQAILGIARIHETRGEWAEAAKVYEKIQTDFPDTPWSGQAEVFMMQVERELRSDG